MPLPFSSWAPEPRVVLTYASDMKVDGIGAQLQRIFGLYAASRLCQVSYLHTPLLNLDTQGLPAGPAFEIERYNRRFPLPSDVVLPKDYDTWRVRKLDVATIEQARAHVRERNRTFLLNCELPFPLLDENPEAYLAVRPLVKFKRQTPPPIRVAIHLRRRFLLERYRGRLLTNAYYVQTALRACNLLARMKLPFVVELYSDLPLESPTGSLPGVIDVAGMGKAEDFDAIPNLTKYIDTDPLEAFEALATADILILSHSSFSYVPATLNAGGAVLYHRFRHPPMAGWVPVRDDGLFSMKLLQERIRALVSPSN